MQIRIMVSAAMNTQDTIPKFSFLLLQQNDKKHAPILEIFSRHHPCKALILRVFLGQYFKSYL